MALRGKGITQEEAAVLLGVTRQTIGNWVSREELDEGILQNVKEKLHISLEYVKYGQPSDLGDVTGNGIPMFNFPASASNVEMYGDANDVKIVGYLNIPGASKESFALPVLGHSMYPTLENGSWCVLRPITDVQDILWGEIYYIEWGDYRMFKRLIEGNKEDEVTLWSDNQSELINNKPKYAPKTIKKERITKLCLLTDILKKPNY